MTLSPGPSILTTLDGRSAPPRWFGPWHASRLLSCATSYHEVRGNQRLVPRAARTYARIYVHERETGALLQGALLLERTGYAENAVAVVKNRLATTLI